MTQQRVIAESMGFTPSALLDLFVFDGTAIGMSTPFYFYDGTSSSFQPVIFNSLSYTPFPIKMSDFSTGGKGTLPRPKLTASNINGFISALLLQNDNLIGATVIRRRVFARFIDAANWTNVSFVPPWVTPDPTAAYPDEPFIVNRKTAENPQIVQWELVSPLELQNATLPRRQIIAGVCAAWKYRQQGTCNYSGVPVADSANRTFVGYYGLTLVDQGTYSSGTTYNAGDYVLSNSTLSTISGISMIYVCIKNGTVGITPAATANSNWVADACAKTCAACKLRFPNEPLRGSFFPGVARAPWIATR